MKGRFAHMFITNPANKFIIRTIAVCAAALILAGLLAVPALAAGPVQTDIGAEQAETIALEQAGLAAEEVSRLRAVQDRDDGALEYEVEFFTDETEFDYSISAATGAVWQQSQELRQRGRQADGDIGSDAAQAAALAHAELAVEEAQGLAVRKELDDGYLEYEVRWLTDSYAYEYVIDGAAGTVWQWEKTMLPAARTAPADGTAQAAAVSTGDIGADVARDAALARAGLTLDQVTRMHVERETTDDYSFFGGGLRDVYEVSFRQGRTEYECVVDAVTGEVLEYDSEYDD